MTTLFIKLWQIIYQKTRICIGNHIKKRHDYIHSQNSEQQSLEVTRCHEIFPHMGQFSIDCSSGQNDAYEPKIWYDLAFVILNRKKLTERDNNDSCAQNRVYVRTNTPPQFLGSKSKFFQEWRKTVYFMW